MIYQEICSRLWGTINISVYNTPNFQEETLHFPLHLDQISLVTAVTLT